jgi:nucleoside-diphosphate kinase
MAQGTLEQTLVIIKPDAHERGIVPEILDALRDFDLSISSAKEMTPTLQQIQEHYAEHRGKEFFDGLCEFMTSGKCTVMVISGPPG